MFGFSDPETGRVLLVDTKAFPHAFALWSATGDWDFNPSVPLTEGECAQWDTIEDSSRLTALVEEACAALAPAKLAH